MQGLLRCVSRVVGEAMSSPDQQPAKRRAFSYTEMMNSGQQRLSLEQIKALQQQAPDGSDDNDSSPTTKP